MLLELVLTLVLLAVNFFTAIALPFGLPNIAVGIDEGVASFVSFFPSFPLIPYKAIAISFAVVLSVFLLTIAYKIVRAALSLLLK